MNLTKTQGFRATVPYFLRKLSSSSPSHATQHNTTQHNTTQHNTTQHEISVIKTHAQFLEYNFPCAFQ